MPLTWVEWVIVALFAIGSFEVFGLNLVDAAVRHRVYVGAGTEPNNSLQYLAWATDAAHHGLIANLYGLDDGSHVFLHPIWLLTGLLHVDLDVPYVLLLGLWQALTMILLLVVVRRYAQLVLGDSRWPRAIALALALFLVSPFFALHIDLDLTVHGQWTAPLGVESYATQWVSGDFPLGLTVAAMVGYLIALERLLGAAESATLRRELLGRSGFVAAGLGALAALLHPWQGTELAVLTLGMALWNRPLSRRNLRLLLPLVAIAIPLIYYLVLPKIDAGWATADASGPNRGMPLLAWLTTFGLSLIASAPGWRAGGVSDRQRLLKLWPLAVAVTFIAAPTGRYATFAGVSIPLALLAVQGWRRVLADRRRAGRHLRVPRGLVSIGLALLVLGAIPETVWLVTTLREGGNRVAQLDRSDASALIYLAGQPRGGVLTTADVGLWVPALSDDHTYVGHYVWTPEWKQRRNSVGRLFAYTGKRPLNTRATLALLGQKGIRYVLEPCRSQAVLGPLLQSHGYRRRVIGCARIYTRR